LIAALWGQAATAADPPQIPLLVLDPGGHTAIVAGVQFSPDGSRLVSVSHDKTIRLWDVATGEPLGVLRPPIGPGGQGMLYAGALSPDGRWLAVAGLIVPSHSRSYVYLISLESGRIERVLAGHTNAVFALEFSSDGRTLASAGTDKTARIWDVATGQCRHVLAGHREIIADVAFSPDAKSLATACRDGTARIWSLADAETTAVLAGHRADVGTVAWSPDGRTVATGSDDGSIRLWSPQGALQTSHPDRGGKVGSLAFTPDGRRLLYTLVSDPQRTGGYVHDIASGKMVAKFTGYDTSVYGGALSPDGKLAATSGGSANEISVWRTDTGALVQRMAGRGRSVVSCGWGPDGKTIAWGNTLKPTAYNDYGPLERAFQPADLQLVPLPSVRFSRARPSRDGASLQRTGEYSIVFNEPGQAARALGLGQRERVLCSTLLPDRRAAVGSSHGLFLFDTRTGGRLGEFRGHAGYVSAVAPSPDDRYLLSASFDQTLRIWDPDRRTPRLSIFVVAGEWVAWTPEGYYAASPGGERLMGWQINHGWEQMASFYPAVRFRKSLYRPDVIKLVLDEGSTDQALAVANLASGRTGDPTDVSRVLPPTVEIASPTEARLDVSQPRVEIRAVATPRRDEPIVGMRLLLDGRPYQGRQGQRNIVRDRAGAGPVRQSWTVELTPGVHQIAVKAETVNSSAVSRPLTVGFAPDQVELPSLYVLVVGLSEHEDARQRLRFGAKDAKTLAAVLQKTTPPVFRNVTVRVLADEEATRRGILEGLDWLTRQQLTPRDVALFAFSGHGVKNGQGVFFLFPFDGEPENVTVSGVSEEEIKRYCQSIPGRLLLLLDACHSGAIGGDFQAGQTAMADDLVRDLLTEDYGVIVMCSSMGRETSLENTEWGHGAFTLALTEGLQGAADYNEDSTIHLNELDLYVADRVEKLTEGRQHPVTQKPTTIRSFPVAKP
jgi:WD40 repeat protein